MEYGGFETDNPRWGAKHIHHLLQFQWNLEKVSRCRVRRGRDRRGATPTERSQFAALVVTTAVHLYWLEQPKNAKNRLNRIIFYGKIQDILAKLGYSRYQRLTGTSRAVIGSESISDIKNWGKAMDTYTQECNPDMKQYHFEGKRCMDTLRLDRTSSSYRPNLFSNPESWMQNNTATPDNKIPWGPYVKDLDGKLLSCRADPSNCWFIKPAPSAHLHLPVEIVVRSLLFRREAHIGVRAGSSYIRDFTAKAA